MRFALACVVCFMSLALAKADDGSDYPPLTQSVLGDEIRMLESRIRQAYAELGDSDYYGEVKLVAWDQQSSGSSSATNSSASSNAGGSGDLAAKSQNPVSDLVSLPLQSNFDFGNDPGNRTRYTGNLQPVIPFKVNDNWNLISRAIIPFVNVPFDGDMREHGIGDSLFQFYLSPRDATTFVWGLGPSFLAPTASDPRLGFQEWGVGVNGVVLLNKSPVLTGVLVSQVWSTEGTAKPFLVQPFFNYNFSKGWFFAASGELNADWEQPEDRRVSFPLGAGMGRIFPIFGQPVSVSTRFAPYLEKPPGGPDWQFRLSVTYLFPK